MEPETRNALPQLRRGVLEFCVLALLADEERYAYDIVEDLGAMHEFVATQWRESEQGPPRRYYRLTATGSKALSRFAEDWARFRDSVDQLVNPKGTS